MKHFADRDYSIDEAIARYEGLPFLPKKAELNSQPFANPVPLEDRPGYTAGGESIEEALENAPSAVGTGVTSKSKCECWDGYKRVPGTKPCAPGSCEKCDSHNAKTSNFNKKTAWPSANPTEVASWIQADANSAAKEILWYAENYKDDPAKSADICIDQLNSLKTSIDVIIPWVREFGQPTTEGLGHTSSQGDQPSPTAAKAVLHALESGDNNSAKDLLGMTDCPKGCEVHAEGKCNHGFMSAGRTRVRYLVDNTDLGNKE